MANEIKVIISAKDAATAVINAVGKSVNSLAYEFKQADIKFSTLKNVGNNLIDAGSKMVLTGGAVLTGFAMAVSKAAEMKEIQEKFNIVTGEGRGMAEDFAKTLQDSYSLSEIQAKKFLSTMGQFLLPMGLTRTESVKLSNDFVKLAADIGEFNQASPEEVMNAMEKAIAGTYKGLKQYGIILDQTDVEQEAYRLGLVKSKDEITDSIKVYATLSLIQKRAGDAVGESARSYDDYDKVLQRFKNSIGDVQKVIGEQLIESASKSLSSITEVINSTKEWAKENSSLIGFIVKTVSGMAALTLAIGAINIGFGFLFKGVIASYKALITIPLAITKIRGVAGGIQTLIDSAGAAEAVSGQWALVMKIGLAGSIAFTSVALYQLIKSIKEYNAAWDENAQSIDDLSAQESKYMQIALKAAKETGLRIRNQKELGELQQKGIVMYDREAGVFKKVKTEIDGHNKALDNASDKLEITGGDLKKFKDKATDAYKSAKNKAKEYADKLIEIDSTIVGHKDKIQQMLRESQREGMSSLEAYQDKQREIEERKSKATELISQATIEKNQQAQEKLFQQAQEQMDTAISLANELGSAITQTDSAGNDVVIQSMTMSRQYKESALTSLGELQNQIDEKIKNSFKNNKIIFDQTADEIKKRIDELPKDVSVDVDVKINEDNYYKTVDLIKQVTGEKTLDLDIKVSKGTIPGFDKKIPGMAIGGRLPGYGGGDRINILAEAGEFIIRKEAVKKWGAGLFAAFNSLKVPFSGISLENLSSISLPKMSNRTLAFAAGGIVPNLQIKNLGQVDLNIGNKIYPVMGDANILETLKTELKRERLKRPI